VPKPQPDDQLVRRAAWVLPEVDQRLIAAYGTVPLGNKSDPLDELVYIQLSIRTREGAYSNVYSTLKEMVGADWGRLTQLPDALLLSVLMPGGMAAVKLARLRAQIQRVQAVFGEASLDPLRFMDDAEAEGFLASLPGVGPKAARCVLLYSLDRDVFPVDSHCFRILDRLGFVPQGLDRKRAHDFLQSLVPPKRRLTLHVNMVHHGRALCVPAQPHCGECPLLDLCPTGQARMGLT
jgi:endonuclease III